MLNLSLLQKIIEASSTELNHSVSTSKPSLENLYGRCLLAYHNEDAAELTRLIKEYSKYKGKDASDLQSLSQVRQNILLMKIQKEDIATLINVAESTVIPQGEIEFICGLAFDSVNAGTQAYRAYQAAFKSFNEAGLHKRAVQTSLKLVFCKDGVYSDALHMADYLKILKIAEEVNCDQTIGQVLVHVSEEFQSNRSYEVALKYIKRATDHYRQHMYGSREYYISHLRKCDIELDLDRVDDAMQSYDEIERSGSLKGRKEMAHISARLAAKKNMSLKSKPKAASSWAGRIAGSDVKLSKKEVSLIELLSQKPMQFNELLNSLYDDNNAYDVRSNRLRQLLFRMRRKLPNSFEKRNGYYSFLGYKREA